MSQIVPYYKTILALMFLLLFSFPAFSLAQNVGSVTQAKGEAIISSLVTEISRKYPPHKQTNLLEFYFIRADSGEIMLLKGTDLFIGKEHGGPAILELNEKSLSKGLRFAATDDPLSLLANFPAHPKYRKKFIEHLVSSNAAVRIGVLLTLTRMPHSSLVPLLVERLKDDNLDVRRAAILAFGADDRHILSSFMLESPKNMADVQKSIENNESLALSHPYRTSQVEAILTNYLNSPIRISDMSAILNTLVKLQMKEPLRNKVRIHANDSATEAFFQQCYQKLDNLPR